MKNRLSPMRKGLVLLGVVVLASFCGYCYFGYKPSESVWMTIITLSSVGYSERPSMSVNEQLFTCMIIVVGMITVGITCGGFVQMLIEGEIEKSLGHRRNQREISKLRNHVVICGYGRMGQILADEFSDSDTAFVIIDNDDDRLEMIRHAGYLCVEGDTTDESTLLDAGIAHAKSLICALPSDANNMFITLTGRNLNENLQIISRAENKSSVRKMYQAGVNRVVLPTMIGAQQISRLISRPTTADLVELLSQRGSMDVELDEMVVHRENPIVGLSLAEADVDQNNILVIASKKIDGQLIFNPKSDFTISSGDTIIMMGRADDIEAFRDRFSEVEMA